MARYAIDAPTLVHLVDRSVQPGHQLVAPNVIRSAAMELLLADVLAGRRTDMEAMACHDRMTELKLRLLGDRVSRRTAWRLAREQGWETLRDAEYLAIARLQADAFVTVDPDMAARAKGLVPLASVDDLRS
jgi:predicted nucleic acid-binding protein